jgi:outer membrane protein assembly factor BamB
MWKLKLFVMALACAIACASCTPDKASNNTDASRRERAQNAGVPPEVAKASNEWPLPGRDYDNSRYTQDSPISSTNVHQLKEAWRFNLPGLAIAFGMCSTVPLIIDDTVYMQDLYSAVYALDLATGKIKWSVPDLDLNPGPNGVAVGWGKVFAIKGSFSVAAYDAATGEQLWNKRVMDTQTAGIDIQPTLFDGQVLISTVPISTAGIYTPGDRGILKALDQATGEERWRFDTIKDPDFWGNADVNSGGGAWFPPAIDIDAGRVFWAIANPAPFPGTVEFPNGTSRSGENLYTNSTLALDVRTGAYEWHHQTVPHDLFDRDLIHTMLTEVDGVPAVVSTGKEGRVWAYRRDTGKLLWGPVSVGLHENDELTELTQRTRVLPGGFGGVLTPPALADGVVYVAALNAGTAHEPSGMKQFSSELGTMNGDLVAIDAKTGKILWDASVDGDPTGGVTVINDLVITATLQGNVIAYSRDRGEEIWRWTAPGGINAWLSVSGDTLVIPVGSAYPATVVALKLGNGAEAAAATGGGSSSQGGGPVDPNAFSTIYKQLIAPRCAGMVCHSASLGGRLSIPASATASTVRASIVDHAATGSECSTSDMSLVVPGEPDMSLLYRKLTNEPPCGSRMPPASALTASELDRVRQWIANGALDD